MRVAFIQYSIARSRVIRIDRLQPVVRLGDLGVLADPVGQPVDDLAGEDLGVGGTRVGGGERLEGKGHSRDLSAWRGLRYTVGPRPVYRAVDRQSSWCAPPKAAFRRRS